LNQISLLFFSVALISLSIFLPHDDIFAETVNLLPTDDAYVAINTANPNDPVTELNTGDYEFLKTFYSFNATGTELNVVSLVYLKFDLSGLTLDEIKSATLNLNTMASNVNTATLPVFKAEQNNWDESSLTFSNKPIFNPPLIDVAEMPLFSNWVQWDVTNAIQQNNSTDITFVIGLDEFQQNSEEEIDFHSKESLVNGTHPFLELTFDIPSEKTPNNYLIKKLSVTEDAYVGANYANLQGSEEMRNTNLGSLNFTKIWYSYNATGTDELFVSTGFLKFDLSELNPANVISAELKMYDILASTSGADRVISVFTVDNSTWTESELTFNNKPELVKKISDTQIDVVNNWISWNVTDAIKESTNSELTLSIIYDNLFLGHEEQTVFNSKEAQENQPYLEIVYDESNEGGGCLIATAAYGSELAPQVQQLRELRDNHLLQTSSGTAFMESFNSIYYSFSPYIADLERENPVFKEAVKLLITPLISSLSILNYIDMDSESSVLGYGLSIIALNVGIYFVSPVMGLVITKKIFSQRNKIHNL